MALEVGLTQEPQRLASHYGGTATAEAAGPARVSTTLQSIGGVLPDDPGQSGAGTTGQMCPPSGGDEAPV